jgi:lysozyme family protein
MAASNRMASFLATMRWEGGDALSLDPRDPGNWTGGRTEVGALVGSQWGVSAPVALKNGLRPGSVTADEALKLFVEAYWLPISADHLPAGLDHAASDDAYNAGPAGALRRIAKVQSDKAHYTVAARIHAYSALRLSFLESLRTWRVFRVGWARRVAGVEAESLKMAITAQNASAKDGGRSTSLRSRSAEAPAFATPADILAPPAEKITLQSIARSAAAAHQASKGGRAWAGAATAAGGGWVALAQRVDAPRFAVVAVIVVAALNVASQLWAWLVHGARRDALDELAAALAGHSAD